MSKSYNDLPPEVIINIFRYLPQDTLLECQNVSKFWHRYASQQFLQEISLLNRYEVNQFLYSFVKTASNESLKSVKKISVGESSMPLARSQLSLNKETIKELILNFPNLKEIVLENDLLNISIFSDSAIVKDIKEKCPQLQSIKLTRIFNYSNQEKKAYYKLLHQLRHQITNIDITEYDFKKYQGLISYLTSFKRLDTLFLCTSLESDSLNTYLPLFDQLCLKNLSIYLEAPDAKDFVEKYLESKSKDEQERFKANLASITSFNATLFSSATIDCMEFIMQYLTGLEKFRLFSISETFWSNAQKIAYCNKYLDFICQREDYHVAHLDWEIDSTLENYPQVIKKHFYQIPPNYKHVQRNVKINLNPSCGRTTFNFTSIRNWNTILRNTVLEFNFHESPIEDLEKLVANAFTNIDSLEFDSNLNHGHLAPENDSIWLFSIFVRLVFTFSPSLNKVFLHVPTGFDWKKYLKEYEIQPVNHVNTLILDAELQHINEHHLYNLTLMFPNLKSLQLLSYLGTWVESLFKFNLFIPSLSLERFHLNLNLAKHIRLEDGTYCIFPSAYLKITTLDTAVTNLFTISLCNLSIKREKDKGRSSIYSRNKPVIHIILKHVDYLKLELNCEIFNGSKTINLANLD